MVTKRRAVTMKMKMQIFKFLMWKVAEKLILIFARVGLKAREQIPLRSTWNLAGSLFITIDASEGSTNFI